MAVAVDALPEGEDGVLDNYTKVRLNQLVERGRPYFPVCQGLGGGGRAKAGRIYSSLPGLYFKWGGPL